MTAESWRARLGLGGFRRRPAGAVRAGGVRRLRRRVSPRVIFAAAAVLALLLGAWLWLRDSSLVAIKQVTISGLSGSDAPAIRAALTRAARNMTTLDVHTDQLNTAVAPYSVVKRLEVSTQFPHGIRIRVIEQVPVGAITVDGRTMAVAGDGTLLRDVRVTGSMPLIPLRVPPGGSRLAGQALDEVEVLAAAPGPLRASTSGVTSTSSHGLEAQLRRGPSIYFGDASQLGAKWRAAAVVLADAGSAGAAYIDVTDPQRPAAGGGTTTPSATATGTAATPSATATGTSTTPITAATGTAATPSATATGTAATPSAAATGTSTTPSAAAGG